MHHSVHNAGPGRSRDHRSTRPTASQGPRPGYGEGRGHYYAPKGIFCFQILVIN